MPIQYYVQAINDGSKSKTIDTGLAPTLTFDDSHIENDEERDFQEMLAKLTAKEQADSKAFSSNINTGMRGADNASSTFAAENQIYTEDAALEKIDQYSCVVTGLPHTSLKELRNLVITYFPYNDYEYNERQTIPNIPDNVVTLDHIALGEGEFIIRFQSNDDVRTFNDMVLDPSNGITTSLLTHEQEIEVAQKLSQIVSKER